MTIRAIYEGGVFRPLGQVDLPERCEVEIDPKPVVRLVTEIKFSDEPRQSAAKDAIYAILGERYRSGETDIAERHNEHQP